MQHSPVENQKGYQAFCLFLEKKNKKTGYNRGVGEDQGGQMYLRMKIIIIVISYHENRLISSTKSLSLFHITPTANEQREKKERKEIQSPVVQRTVQRRERGEQEEEDDDD